MSNRTGHCPRCGHAVSHGPPKIRSTEHLGVPLVYVEPCIGAPNLDAWPPRRRMLVCKPMRLNGMCCVAAYDRQGHVLYVYEQGDMGEKTLQAVGALCAAGLMGEQEGDE